MNLFRLRHEVRTAIWLVPVLFVFGFLGLAIVTLAIDRASGFTLIGQSLLGSPTAVQQIVSTAAGSMLSLATVVLSLTLVAVQLAMGQFSPRIVRALLEDRRSQICDRAVHRHVRLRDGRAARNRRPDGSDAWAVGARELPALHRVRGRARPLYPLRRAVDTRVGADRSGWGHDPRGVEAALPAPQRGGARAGAGHHHDPGVGQRRRSRRDRASSPSPGKRTACSS